MALSKNLKFDRNTILMQDSEIAGIINATSTSGGIMLGENVSIGLFLYLTPFLTHQSALFKGKSFKTW